MRLLALLTFALLSAGCLDGGGAGGGSGSPGPTGPAPAFALAPFLSGLDDPVALTHAGDGSGRLFVVEQEGFVRVVRDGKLLETPFLDIAAGGPDALVVAGGERGLLGLAFHPSYETNGRFVVYYTGARGDIVLAEYRNPQPADDVADPATAKVLLTIEHREHANHNGGALAFGPDAMLYAGVGDGGSAGDPGNNAQDLDSLLGKVLRLDVDGTCGQAVCAPADNPFVGKDGRDEVWAYGLRNPWRFAFDRATGDLWIADVGQNKWEEVDRIPAGTGGLNFGWSRFEGDHLFRAERAALDAVGPVLEYAHDEAGGTHCSITGGFVYRGAAVTPLQGHYVFGDYCSGWVWTAPADGDGGFAFALDSGLNLSAFGEDEAGELYAVDHGGVVRKVVAG